jgi:protein MpaA
MRGGLTPVAAGCAAAASVAALLWAAPAPERSAAQTVVPPPSPLTVGHSVQGRAIVAERIGDPAAERVALAIGVIHGDERAGLAVLRALRRRADRLDGVQIWLLDSLNPDGQRARSRKNANGVDLNRNFPHRWRGGAPRSNGYHPGPAPASEPETQAALELVERIRPDVSVWYHQPWGAVLACRGRPPLAGRYARLVRMPRSCRGRGLHGTAIGWQNATYPESTAFVVEFGRGGIGKRAARRHARALATIAGDD